MVDIVRGAVAGNRRLLLIVEDVQWMNLQSVRLLLKVRRRGVPRRFYQSAGRAAIILRTAASAKAGPPTAAGRSQSSTQECEGTRCFRAGIRGPRVNHCRGSRGVRVSGGLGLLGSSRGRSARALRALARIPGPTAGEAGTGHIPQAPAHHPRRGYNPSPSETWKKVSRSCGASVSMISRRGVATRGALYMRDEMLVDEPLDVCTAGKTGGGLGSGSSSTDGRAL